MIKWDQKRDDTDLTNDKVRLDKRWHWPGQWYSETGQEMTLTWPMIKWDQTRDDTDLANDTVRLDKRWHWPAHQRSIRGWMSCMKSSTRDLSNGIVMLSGPSIAWSGRVDTNTVISSQWCILVTVNNTLRVDTKAVMPASSVFWWQSMTHWKLTQTQLFRPMCLMHCIVWVRYRGLYKNTEELTNAMFSITI